MEIRFYIVLTLIVFWTYFCLAKVTQQNAQIEYYDEQYISEAKAFTKRRRRGDTYHSNFTLVTKVPMDNNVTIKIAGKLKSIGNIVFLESKLCDGFNIIWFKRLMELYSNFTSCPLHPDKYEVVNLEIPPPNFNLPVPKGEGTLHLYCYRTRNMQLILQGMMYIVSS